MTSRRHTTAAGFLIGNRVQMPVHTDAWMSGDRYGEIVAFGLPRNPTQQVFARVRLDKSGRTVRVTASDLRFA